MVVLRRTAGGKPLQLLAPAISRHRNEDPTVMNFCTRDVTRRMFVSISPPQHACFG
jgi:hypothetical protein